MRKLRPSPDDEHLTAGGQYLEIGKDHIFQYAHYGYVYCMLIANGIREEREVLISGGGDGVVKLWKLDPNNAGIVTEIACLENGDASVLTLAVDGTILYCGRLEGEINVWDLDTCQLIRRVRAHTVDVLALSVGHGLIFSGGANGVAEVL